MLGYASVIFQGLTRRGADYQPRNKGDMQWGDFELGKLAFDQEKCIGCQLCQMACSAYNEGVFNPQRSRLRITVRYSGGSLEKKGALCDLCLACVDACGQEAVFVRDGRLIYEADKCTGCQACVDACPQQLIRTDAHGYPLFCSLCLRCVEFCPTGALYTADVADTR